MKKNKGSHSPITLIFLLVLVSFLTFSNSLVEAKKHHHAKKHKSHKHKKDHKGNNGTSPDPYPNPNRRAPYLNQSVFDITSFGAKGDGVSDDSKALLLAWESACKIGGAKVEIPSGFEFLIKPVTLQGPCMPQLVLQIDGTILAPSKLGSWKKANLLQWINFKWINNFTIQGSGVVDGQGSNWWTFSNIYNIQKKSKFIPITKPTALRFYSSYDVTVKDIAMKNSPQCHLKFDSSKGIRVENITITSPENSPNTDGIHLQNTRDVQIQHSTIGCGDDCVSIQTGCSNVHIHHINCGPGHGISIGGLGKDKTIACVSNIIVENVSMQNTQTGVRIKTWQGGMGSVKNVTFSNIEVADVKVPIIIDQYYCDKNKFCKNQSEAVAISDVKYDRIIGTFSNQPIRLACSKEIPCTGVDLIGIRLNPSPHFRGFKQALCLNSYGKSESPLEPSGIDYCARAVGGPIRKIARSHFDHMCFPKLV